LEAAIASAELRVLPDASAVAGAAAELWAQTAHEAVRSRGVFRVALSGGSTPEGLYALLAQKRSPQPPWTDTEMFWADERYVPHHHADNNYNRAQHTLMIFASIPEHRLHPIRTDSEDAAHAAADYERVMRSAFPEQDWPVLDLALLGLGEDGHTASLFPKDPALAETRLWVCPAQAPSEPRTRITLTLPVFNHARLAVFLICGRSKAGILKRVLSAAETPPLPAQLIRPASGRVIFLADRESAYGL
jgi:6-phosphogluconolactonase